jgi:hypothetical protein
MMMPALPENEISTKPNAGATRLKLVVLIDTLRTGWYKLSVYSFFYLFSVER